jgi:hypothetical protein
MKRTEKQVAEQITGLKAIKDKPTFRRTTMFGDDNEAAIEAQIEVLEEGLTTDQVCEMIDDEEYDDHVGDSARQAADWLCGDEDDDPVAGWEGLY